MALAQSLEQTVALADEQVTLNNYEGALRHYRRALFFDDGSQRLALCQKLADCYLQLGNTKQGTYFLDAAYAAVPESASADSLKNELIFDKTAALIRAGDYNFAQLELLNLNPSLPPEFDRKRTFYTAVIHFQLEDFEASKTAFLALCGHVEGNADRIDALFEQNRKLKRINPNKVRMMSVIVPGLGQFWCGDVKNGLNSLLLTGGFAALFVAVGAEFTLIDALVSVMPWYQRYYIGGYQKAYEIAQNKVQSKRNVIYQQLLLMVAQSSL